MICVKVVNGIIIERISGSTIPEGFEQDTIGASFVGANRKLFDDKWNPRKLSEIVSENVVSIPEGMKLNDTGTDFVTMDDSELIAAGIIIPAKDEKIETGKIVKKTMAEQFADGTITVDEYNKYIVSLRRAAYQEETDAIFWDYQEGKATKAEWQAAKKAITDRLKKV